MPAGERVVGVRRTIVFEPQHRTEMRAWILGLMTDVPTVEADRRIAAVADTEQQAVVRQPDHSGTEVLAAGLGVGILEDDLRVPQSMPVKATTGKRRAIRSPMLTTLLRGDPAPAQSPRRGGATASIGFAGKLHRLTDGGQYLLPDSSAIKYHPFGISNISWPGCHH